MKLPRLPALPNDRIPPMPEHPAVVMKREERIQKRKKAAFIRHATPVLLAGKKSGGQVYADRREQRIDAINEAERLADMLADRGYL